MKPMEGLKACSFFAYVSTDPVAFIVIYNWEFIPRTTFLQINEALNSLPVIGFVT